MLVQKIQAQYGLRCRGIFLLLLLLFTLLLWFFFTLSRVLGWWFLGKNKQAQYYLCSLLWGITVSYQPFVLATETKSIHFRGFTHTKYGVQTSPSTTESLRTSGLYWITHSSYLTISEQKHLRVIKMSTFRTPQNNCRQLASLHNCIFQSPGTNYKI